MKKVISIILLLGLLMFNISACTPVDRNIATVNDEAVKMTYFNYYLQMLKSQLQTPEGVDAKEYWDNNLIEGKPVAQYAKDKSLEQAIKLVTIAQKAKEMGIGLTDEDKANFVKDDQEMLKNAGGSHENLKKQLQSIGMSVDAYKVFREYSALGSNLMLELEKGYTEEQIKDFYNTKMVNVKHVLLTAVDEQRQPLPNEQVEENKQKAEEALAKIKAGEDFEKIRSEYDQDPGATEDDNGYTLSKYSSYVEPFLTQALELQVNQVSDIVQTEFGFHIIKRFEHVNNNEIYTAAQTEIKNSLFEETADNWKNEANIVINHAVLDSVKLNGE